MHVYRDCLSLEATKRHSTSLPLYEMKGLHVDEGHLLSVCCSSTSETAQPQAVSDAPVDPTPAPTPAPTPTSVVVSPSEQSSAEAGEGAMSTVDRGGDEASGWVMPSEVISKLCTHCNY